MIWWRKKGATFTVSDTCVDQANSSRLLGSSSVARRSWRVLRLIFSVLVSATLSAVQTRSRHAFCGIIQLFFEAIWDGADQPSLDRLARVTRRIRSTLRRENKLNKSDQENGVISCKPRYVHDLGPILNRHAKWLWLDFIKTDHYVNHVYNIKVLLCRKEAGQSSSLNAAAGR